MYRLQRVAAALFLPTLILAIVAVALHQGEFGYIFIEVPVRYDVPVLIEESAQTHGLTPEQTQLAKDIAWAESQYLNKCNVDQGCRAGIGIFQFVWSTWITNCDGNVLNVPDNIDCGVRLIGEGQVGHWKQSEAGWKNK